MFFRPIIKLIIALAAVFLVPHNYIYAVGDSAVAYIKNKPLSKADFAAFWQAQHLDSARVALAIKRNVYVPQDQTCSATVPVFGRLTFSYKQIEKSLQKNGTLKSLTAFTATLYKLIGEPVIISTKPKINKAINYYNRALTCKNLFDSLSTAAWAFDCGGHSEMAKVFLDSFGHKKYISKTAQLSRKTGDEVNHIVTLVYYRENKQWYGMALDCQNGMLGPVKTGKDSIPSIAEQRAALNLSQTGAFEIRAIPETELHKKRNLMDDAFYCNVLPDKKSEYHLSYPQSGHKYERLTYSMLYLSWFKSGVIDSKKYAQNLVRLIVKNAPQN